MRLPRIDGVSAYHESWNGSSSLANGSSSLVGPLGSTPSGRDGRSGSAGNDSRGDIFSGSDSKPKSAGGDGTGGVPGGARLGREVDIRGLGRPDAVPDAALL